MKKSAIQLFLPAVVALLVAPAGFASTSVNPPGLAGAQRACQAQGLSIGMSGYVLCLQQQMSGTSPTAPVAGSGSTSTPITVHRAQQICAGKSLLPGSNGFMKCVNSTLTVSARQTCAGKGLTRGSGSFARCVKQHLQTGTR